MMRWWGEAPESRQSSNEDFDLAKTEGGLCQLACRAVSQGVLPSHRQRPRRFQLSSQIFQRSGTVAHAGSGSARQSVKYILALGKRASLFGRLR